MPNFLIWPAVALILGFVALLLFKPAIDRKIADITRASKDGVAFERSQEGVEQQPPLLPFVEIMKQPISPSVLERERAIEQQLQAIGLKTDSEKISVLTRVLATTRVELEFNNIAHIIFGTQITLLVQLVGTKNGISRQQAEAIFEQALRTFPEIHGGRKFEEWFAYLQASNLVTVNEDRIDISQFGKDFLKHLVDARMAHNRHG
ncbi:MAG: hypothetical protein ACYCY2_12240 [Acidithiobacillus ferriphilus]|uniref:hypothetical protein n=1 Tax=Acidithiobacillus ferriphilus TaxID=1689834 RepID=UPI001C06A606|nr:hypothetical protein [Acidithiobacillus ferriphilus]MBU2827134.1 hypothetical protein [Acidithiobacillus ferriphilus]